MQIFETGTWKHVVMTAWRFRSCKRVECELEDEFALVVVVVRDEA